MDKWNPMLEAYEDRQFNRYNEGVGRDLSEGGEQNKIQLFVQNVPPSLDQDGFYNLFAEYGKVKKANLVTSNKGDKRGLFGFVTMERMDDAELAISKLDKKSLGKGFVLRVSPALTKEEKDKRQKLKQASEIYFPTHKTAVRFLIPLFLSPSYSDTGLEFAKGDHQSFSKAAVENNCPPSQDFGNQRQMTERAENILHNQGRGASCQKNQSEGLHTLIGLSGNMQSIGHGDFKSIFPSVINPPKNEDVERKHPCVYCYKEGCVNLCSRCKMYYCSIECQKNDWPRHKDICIAVNEFFSDERSPLNNLDINKSGNRTRLDYNTDIEEDKSFSKKPGGEKSEKKTQSEMQINLDKQHQQKGSPLSVDEKTIFQQEVKLDLPIGYKGQGYLTHYENPSKFWICCEEFLSDFMDMCTAMTEELEKTNPNEPVKPEVHLIYATKYLGDWRRVRVDSVHDNTVTGYYIDYGQTEEVKIENLRCIDVLVRSQAICCCINGLKPKGSDAWSPEAIFAVKEWLGKPMKQSLNFEIVQQRGSFFDVKISKDKESLTHLLVSRGYAELSSKQQKLPKPVKSVDLSVPSRIMVSALEKGSSSLKPGEQLKVLLIYFESVNEFAVIRLDSWGALGEINQLLQSEYAESNLSYSPVPGELVVTKFSGDNKWYRCEVISAEKGLYKLYFLDFGNCEMQSSKFIRPVINPKLASIPNLALKCSLFGLKIPKNLSSDCVTEAFKTIIQDFSKSDQTSLFLVKANYDIISGDFLSESGQLMSILLNKKLHELSGNSQTDTAEQQLSATAQDSVTTQDSITHPNNKKKCDKAREKVSKEDMPIESLPLQGETAVYVTFVKNCGEFYVRNSSKNDKFIAMMKDLNSCIDSAPVLSRSCVGCIVAVQFSLDQLWYRGRVIQIEGNACDVLFIDYGNSERTKLSELRVMPASVIALPAQAIKCELFGNLSTYPEEAHQQFKEFMENEVVNLHIVKKTKDSYSVKLRAQDGTDILALILSGKDVGQNQAEMSSIRSIPNLTFDKILPLKVEFVSIVNASNFYVQISECIESLAHLSIALTSRLEQTPQPIKSINVGDFVASRFSQDKEPIWYRVRVESIKEDKCTVFFVDYGNLEDTEKSGLMMLSDEDLQLPACSVKCKLKGLEKQDVNKISTVGQNDIKGIKVYCQDGDEYIVDVLDRDGKCITSNFISKSQTEVPVKPKQISPLVSSALYKVTKIDIVQEQLHRTEEAIPAVVTHINSCHEVYIQLRKKHLEEDLLKLMVKLNETCETLQPLKNPSVNSVCAAKYSQDGSWYRARVLKIINSTTGIVQFLDYGNSEESSLLDLKTLNPALTKLPAQAIQCCLLGFELCLEQATKATLNPQELHKLRSELLEQQVKIRVVKEISKTWVIEMENERRKIISGEHKIPAAMSQDLFTASLSDLIIETPSVREFEAHLIHFNSFNEFYCQRRDPIEIKELQLLQDQLMENAAKIDPTFVCIPVVGCLYASEFMGHWYRCVVQKILGPNVLIKYIDHGNIEQKKANALRPLTPESLALPVRLLKCKLYGVEPVHPNWESPEITQYIELLLERHPQVVIEEESEDTFLVSLFIVDDDITVNVALDLVDINMAKPIQNPEANSEINTPQLALPNKQDETQREVQDQKQKSPIVPEPYHEEVEALGEEDEDEDIEEMEKQLKILQLQLAVQRLKKKKKC
ncbi:unnamed protein product [Lymnaea stagnalis]|uniref:Tudor domain-containing protein 1 n=1 Tax=Lymnaea stagnalis TaxID=6523 RepID=A0AAV2HQ11_LYMST